MGEPEDIAEAGVITCDEAEQIAARYNNSHWYKTRGEGERARYSIPADPKRDDDIRLRAFIAQARAAQARIAELEATIARVRERVPRWNRLGPVYQWCAADLSSALAKSADADPCSWCSGDGFVGIVPCRECGSAGLVRRP